MTRQDALNLQDIPDEEVTLQDDLLESSNKIFHGDVARFQANQEARMIEIEKEVADWVASETKKNGGVLTEHTAFVADEHLKKCRLRLHDEVQQHIERMREEEVRRNRNILFFILVGRNPSQQSA